MDATQEQTNRRNILIAGGWTPLQAERLERWIPIATAEYQYGFTRQQARYLAFYAWLRASGRID